MTYNYLSQYSLPLSQSLCISTTLWIIFTIAKRRYSQKLLTKKSLHPYYYALVYCLCRILETGLLCYLSQRDLNQGKDVNPDFVINKNTDPFELATNITNCLSKIFFLYFISHCIVACIITYEFMVYQNGYRLQELDIAKQRFNELERKVDQISKLVLFLLAVALLVTDISYSFLYMHYDTKYIGIVYSFLLAITYLMLTHFYGRMHWKMFMVMKRYRIATYRTHACKGLSLVLITIVSIVLTLIKHLFFISWRVCINDTLKLCQSLQNSSVSQS